MLRGERRWYRGMLATLLCLAPVVVLAGDEDPAYYYSYFKEPIPITLDRGRVAVFESTATAEDRGKTLDSALTRLGIAPEEAQRMPISGWWRAELPSTVRSDHAVRQLVGDLGAEPEVAFASPIFKDERGDPLIITRDLFVGFSEATSAAEAERLLSEFAAGEIKDRDYSNLPGVYRVQTHLSSGFEVLALANRLAAQPQVRFAESDMILTSRKSFIPNDTLFYNLWGLHNTGQSGGTVDMDMDGPEAWDVTQGDASIKVVILDDGVQQDHLDINQITGVDYTGHGTDGGPYNECDNHGTAVAGCISAIINNSEGVVGVAPECVVVSVKYSVSNVPCDGGGTFQTSWFIWGLNWAQVIGARVTNASVSFGYSSLIADKYSDTRDAGIVHFASSGNDDEDSVDFPASLSSVNAVGAVDRDGDRASFSNYGDGLAFVGPGASIRSTDRTGSDGYDSWDYTWVDGTSFSCPYVAGVAALVLSVNDSLEPADVEQVMEDTCTDLGPGGYDTEYGWGLVNAYDAVKQVSSGACCLPDGSCVDSENEDWCNNQVGGFRGYQVPCAGLDPPCEAADSVISCALSSPTAFAEGEVTLDLFVEEAEDLATYQATIMATRTSGEGTIYVNCPEGAQIDETRPDFVFSGITMLPAVACDFLQLGAITFGSSVTVGSEPKYLGEFTFNVSADATVGSTFDLTVVFDAANTFLRDSVGVPIPVRTGPVCTLTIIDASSIPKNRYVSFSPGNPETVAYQVEMTSSAYFPSSTGVVGWIGEPFEAPEDPGVWVARLQDTPLFRDWNDHSVLHVGDCAIVPAATYAIRATPDGVVFDTPKYVSTILEPVPKKWGDVVGEFDGSEWAGPDQIVNMDDVMAAVQKFQHNPSAPHVTWVDVDAEVPNVILNMTDILQIVQGFKGNAYPFSDPALCAP